MILSNHPEINENRAIPHYSVTSCHKDCFGLLGSAALPCNDRTWFPDTPSPRYPLPSRDSKQNLGFIYKGIIHEPIGLPRDK